MDVIITPDDSKLFLDYSECIFKLINHDLSKEERHQTRIMMKEIEEECIIKDNKLEVLIISKNTSHSLQNFCSCEHNYE